MKQPTDAPTILCDAMLARLARFLRAAGYDTRLAEPGEGDADLLECCRTEARVLVSRDRAFVSRAALEVATVLLVADDVSGQARALGQALTLDWTLAPFTRCLVDNALLRSVMAEDCAALPMAARQGGGPFKTCLVCGRLYWPGSHVRRMAGRLEKWQASS